jgi:malonate-semialdehyde dehydrogenase (acetylating)/methylmalonate-semialdehyde dehydrogenase
MALVPEVTKHYGKLDLYINGEWVKPETGQYFETTNPATDEVIAEAPIASKGDAEKAISAAHEAFKKWRNVPFRDRAKMVFRLRQKIEERSEWLSRVLVQDHGCTIDEGRGTNARIVENVEAAGSSMYGDYRGIHVDQLATGILCPLCDRLRLHGHREAEPPGPGRRRLDHESRCGNRPAAGCRQPAPYGTGPQP